MLDRGHASSDSIFFSPSRSSRSSRSRGVRVRDWVSNVSGAVSTPSIPRSNECSWLLCCLIGLRVHARTTITPSSTFFPRGDERVFSAIEEDHIWEYIERAMSSISRLVV